jgi:hypothetical protein
MNPKNTHYDAKLVELVVFDRACALESRGEGSAVRPFHLEREAAYREPQGPRREAAQHATHDKWFSILGLDRILPRAADDAGCGELELPPVFVHAVASPLDEGGEVFEKSGVRTVVIAVRASRFGAPEGLLGFFRHEIRLVADLLDPEFEFGGAFREGPGAIPANLAKERYRALWKVSADGRIARRGFVGSRGREDWETLFARIFSFLPADARRGAFVRLWEGARPRHPQLLEWAQAPRRWFAGESAEEPDAERPTPGARCPLCGFSTFDWHPSPNAISPDVLDLVTRRHPRWSPSNGACASCVERYDLASRGAFGRS